MKIIIPVLIIILLLPIASKAQLLSKRRIATENEIFKLSLNVALDEVLWFISSPIEIQREIEVAKNIDLKALQAKGKVKITGGKIYELAKFTSNASALFEFKKSNIIAVRFEHGEKRYLEFKLTKSSKYSDTRYYDLYVRQYKKKKIVRYAGADWQLISGGYAKLEYKAKGNFNRKTKKTKIRGLKKDGTERKGLINIKSK